MMGNKKFQGVLQKTDPKVRRMAGTGLLFLALVTGAYFDEWVTAHLWSLTMVGVLLLIPLLYKFASKK